MTAHRRIRAFEQLSVGSGRSTHSFRQLWELARRHRDLTNFMTGLSRHEKPVSMRASEWPEDRCQQQIPVLRESIAELEMALGTHLLQTSFPAWLEEQSQQKAAPPSPVALKQQKQPSEKDSAESPQTKKKRKIALADAVEALHANLPKYQRCGSRMCKVVGGQSEENLSRRRLRMSASFESFCREMGQECVLACPDCNAASAIFYRTSERIVAKSQLLWYFWADCGWTLCAASRSEEDGKFLLASPKFLLSRQPKWLGKEPSWRAQAKICWDRMLTLCEKQWEEDVVVELTTSEFAEDYKLGSIRIADIEDEQKMNALLLPSKVRSCKISEF